MRSELMIWAIYCSCFAMMALVAFVAIPSDVRELITENCKNSKGHFRLRYVGREAAAVSRFFGQMVFMAAIIAIVLLFGLIILDQHLKLEIVHRAVQQASLNPEEWKQNLRSSPNNVERQFTTFHVQQGGSKESAHAIMQFLWRAIPVMLLLCFAGMLAAMRFSSRIFDQALKALVSEEVKRNRRRIKRQYLRSTKQNAA